MVDTCDQARGGAYVITYTRMPISPYRDAATYDRISAPLERIGNEVLARLELAGDETVLDAGCGSGRVTQGLLERLPRGHVICVDGSPEMIDVARGRLGPSVEYIVADLNELDLAGRRVDAVFSTATFHWLTDHDRLFASLRGVLRPGGRLVAQCGGTGNTAELVAAASAAADLPRFTAHLGGWPGPWNFVGTDETTGRLRRAGFTDIATWLISRPAPYDDLREWLRANALTAHLERLPEDLRQPFVDAVADELGPDPEISYIRLNIDATAADPRVTS
jgi:trans-aconitate 2-methyltransferase